MEREPLLAGGDAVGSDEDDDHRHHDRHHSSSNNNLEVTGDDYAMNEAAQASGNDTQQSQQRQPRRTSRHSHNRNANNNNHDDNDDDDGDDDDDDDDQMLQGDGHAAADSMRAPLLPERDRQSSSHSSVSALPPTTPDDSAGSDEVPPYTPTATQQQQPSPQTQGQQPSLTGTHGGDGDAGGGGGDSDELPDAPPTYEDAVWFNARPVDADIPSLLQATGAGASGNSATTAAAASTSSTSSQPRRHLMSTEVSRALMTPRTVVLQRSHGGFGLAVGGENPVHIIHVVPGSPAAGQGIECGERVLEVNSIDVKTASVATVEAMISGASTLVLTLGPPPPSSAQATIPQQQQPDEDWRAAFRALNTAGNGDGAPNMDDDSTPPASGLPFAMCSMLCCPLVGGIAVWHALRVNTTWRTNDHRTAYMHAVKARKYASSAIFYGFLIVLIYVFASSDPDA